MKVIGIDYGAKRVGTALSDERGMFAFPKMTLLNNKTLIPDLVAFIQKERVEKIVVGESKNFQGKENPIMRGARYFAKELEQETKLPVHFEPEWYTSVEARRLTEMDGEVDAEAAAIILGSYLKKTRPHDDLA